MFTFQVKIVRNVRNSDLFYLFYFIFCFLFLYFLNDPYKLLGETHFARYD